MVVFFSQFSIELRIVFYYVSQQSIYVSLTIQDWCSKQNVSGDIGVFSAPFSLGAYTIVQDLCVQVWEAYVSSFF